ncbi:Pre-mRNA-splicing factor ATP-dependent RNA helicase DEAH10 [Camellia lanceoleosa]|uniref:Pre-mRNA-splicing factor ATP-dependent RNA helicase DEAH10 n=1 Tax=Camellia lanceoleosa TaxID=1840588 RepID=A0ACC0HKJ6_9ERIC|nr:Pre-mRNA-splicing factor ATP-dependent RNA helicase DEAH10 [Camellia lanceoleosa]
MSASLAFSTDAMRLLEDEQFLQLNKKEKDPLKPKQPMSAFFMFRNERRAESKCGWEIAKQNMEKYLEEMEAYKQRKEEGSANPKKEEDEMMKIHKQEALELLKKKEKTKENRQKKKKKIADPNKPKKPASSFLPFRTFDLGDKYKTELPQFLFNAGFCRDGKIIGITQSRCIAAVSVAKWVAEECGVELGQKVGYSVRFDDMTSSSTRVKYMTDGFLSREALLDPYLSRYAVIIVDEAHERTVHTDVLLGLLKSVQNVRSRSVNQCPNIDHMKANNGVMMEKENDAESTGRQFPVDILHTYHPEIDCIDAALIAIFQIHLEEGPGDILVFLTGQEEIEYVEKLVQESLRQLPEDNQKLKVLPIFSSLPLEKQIQVFMPPPTGFRKVILATNIAETSITIPGIKYVVDPRLVKARTYRARTGMKSLIFVPTSKAQALQRSGRAGREGPGKCFRLYPEIEFEKLKDSTIPEITRCNLSNIILQLKALGVDDIFGDAVIKSLEILVLLDAITEEYKLSDPVGHQMARLSLKPIHSKALILASQFNCLEKMLITVAMLSVESIFYAPREKLEELLRKKTMEEYFKPTEAEHSADKENVF